MIPQYTTCFFGMKIHLPVIWYGRVRGFLVLTNTHDTRVYNINVVYNDRALTILFGCHMIISHVIKSDTHKRGTHIIAHL